jgi:hypothetical protein
MPGLRVVRPREVDAYECDGPTCREVCDSSSGGACGWVDFSHPGDRARGEREEARRWFCSFRCLAEWACAMEEAAPLRTRQAVLPPAVPF